MISLFKNTNSNFGGDRFLSHFNYESTQKVSFIHSTIPNYKPTPLIDMKGLSKHLGLKKIWIKDESYRFGLNAFKVLGASYAVINYLSNLLKVSNPSFLTLVNNKKALSEFVLVTATDGNHGRGVAWIAQQLGCKSVVYMPKGTSQSRFENIKSLGADVTIINGSYDNAVDLAKENSIKYGWLLIQDTSWQNYQEIPLMIMQGYLTIMKEIFYQLKDEIPTHVFVQCGVGSLPAAILAYLINQFKENKPIFVVVEPEDAGCMYESVRLSSVTTLRNEIKTIMAGLACGTPSKIAFDILKSYSNYFIKCSDDVTINGMQILGRQEFGDLKIISGESGAVTTGLLHNLLCNEELKNQKEEIKLNSESKVLLISTEGNTDPIVYDKILTDSINFKT